MAWLMLDDEVLASLDVARTRSQRRRGLRGLEEIERPLLIAPCRSVHTLGMRRVIDVVFLDREGVIVAIASLPPRRVTRVHMGAAMVIEADGGAVERWGLAPGDRVDIKGVDFEYGRFGLSIR